MGAPAREIKFTVLWDDSQDFLRITCWGDYYEEDAQDLIREVQRVIGDKKNILILTDLTRAKTACRMARKIFKQTFNDETLFKKHAIVAGNIIIKTIILFVLRDTPRNNVRFFSSEENAISWLKDRPFDEKNEIKPCESLVSDRLHDLLPVLQSVATGDFTKKVLIPKEENVFTELFVAINLMIDDLIEYDRITKEHEHTLEKSIQERTKELQESMEKYQLLFDNSPIGVGLTSLEGEIIATNPAHQKMSGYSEDELRKVNVETLYAHPEQRETFISLLKKDGIVANFPIKYKSKDGIIRDVLLNARFVQISGKKFIQTMLTDITEHEQLAEALKISELRYKKLFELSKDGILILEESTGIIIDANQAIMSLLGYAREEFLGKYIWDVPSLKALVMDTVALTHLRETGFVRREDIILRAKNNTPINTEFIGFIYPLNSHKVVQCTIRDISDRKKIEEELKEYVNGLENINKIMVGRELKMIELKQEIERLKKRTRTDQD